MTVMLEEKFTRSRNTRDGGPKGAENETFENPAQTDGGNLFGTPHAQASERGPGPGPYEYGILYSIIPMQGGSPNIYFCHFSSY